MGVKVREKPKGSGVWWVFVSHNGKRKSKKIGRKKNVAQGVAAKIEAKLVLGDFNLDEKKGADVPTFDNYADNFMESYSRLNHKPSTVQSYNNSLDVHLRSEFGVKPLNEITRIDIKKFLIKKQTGGLSGNTVRILQACLSSIFEQAVDDEIIGSNPARGTGRFIKKKETQSVNPFTWEEKAKFERAMLKHFPKYYPFFLTALRTGMREGELIALKPGDIDFNGNFIEVQRNCVRGNVNTPKNGKSRRVDMSAQLASFLKDYLVARKRDALKNGWGEPTEWLFYNENGAMIDVANLRKRIFYKCLEKAKLRRIRLHDLRSTYATLRIQSGHNIADVSKQLGHHSIRVTVDTYYKWIPGTGNQEVNELDLEDAPQRTPSAPSHENQREKGQRINANPL